MTVFTNRRIAAAAVVAAALAAGGIAAPTLVLASPAYADSGQPESPSGYANVVQFGAHEDHDLYPDPGNVIGDVRSEIASTGDGLGISTFVFEIKQAVGSSPNPPGRD